MIALDKSKNKLKKIKENSDNFGLTCIEIYGIDATKAHDETAGIYCADQTLLTSIWINIISYSTPTSLKFRSREINTKICCIALKFKRRLHSTAVETPVKFQSHLKILKTNLGT